MIKKLTFFLWFAIPFFCMAQNLQVQYDYDASGNRILRKYIEMPPNYAPPALPDSTETNPQVFDGLVPQYSPTSPEHPTFVESIAQVAIKIYPNPTTEKITLEIPEWQNLQTGTFKLYALTGQLLQEQSVHAVHTIVSLAGLSTGTYILKVHINGRTEDWKIIKR